MDRTAGHSFVFRSGRATRLVIATALLAVTGVAGSATTAHAQGVGRALFEAADAVGDLQTGAEMDRTTRRGRRVRARLAALQQADGDITLNLFDDAQLRARRSRLEPTTSGGQLWTGRLLDVPGYANIAFRDGVMAGTVFAGERVFEIAYVGDGRHEVSEIEPAAFPPDDSQDQAPLVQDDPRSDALDAAIGDGAAGDSAAQVDVMVVWTPAARAAAGGVAAIQSLVDLAVANTNTAYANSAVTQRLRLVHAAEVTYAESGISTDLSRLAGTADGQLDAVHGLRDTYGADVVTLLGHGYTSGGYCGIGYLMTSASTSFAPYAFNVVDRACTAGNLSYAHEVGHNLGLHHDPANASGAGAYSYAYGYQQPAGAFRTVMAYACPGGNCPRVPHFSNPSISFNGMPTGTASQDNARTLNNTAPSAANFRQAVTATCTFALGRTTASMGSGGGASTVSVTAGAGCGWTAVSQASWITVTSGASGRGTGVVGYSVAPNTAATPRAGTVAVGGQTFTVNQEGAACQYSVSPLSLSVSAANSAFSLTVSATTGCDWTATSGAGWLAIQGGSSGSGSGAVSVGVSFNSSTTGRNGSLTVAGRTVSVTQAGVPPVVVTGLTADRTSPMARGTTITWTASATGGPGALEYQFWRYRQSTSTWTMVRSYSTARTYSWTPGVGDADTYQIQVWARTVGSSASHEAYRAFGPFVVNGPAPLRVSLARSDASGAAMAGTPLTWTARATGGLAPTQFKFWLYAEGSGWQVLRDYGASARLDWTPLRPGRYVLQVWARNPGSLEPYDAWTASEYLDVAPGPQRVSLRLNRPMPSPVGVPLTLSAVGSGPVEPLEYQFWLLSDGAWTVLRPYERNPDVQWTPTTNGTKVIQVWSRRVGHADMEAWTSSGYLTVATTAVALTEFTSNQTVPLPAGTPITWTAQAGGGSADLQYQFYRYSNGAWVVAQPYGSLRTYTWTPLASDAGTHIVQVWVRSVGSQASYEAWASTGQFGIQP